MSHWRTLLPELAEATASTLWMVGVATLLTVVIGLPLGMFLVATDKGGVLAMPRLHRVIGALVEIGASLPFLVLLIGVIPVTRAIVGSSVGAGAAVVPLTVGAVPFFAHRVEVGLRAVDRGAVDAAHAMGARARHILLTVLLREGLPRLITGLALTIVVLLGYSAIVGVLDGQGLGALAVTYGYEHLRADAMVAIVVIFVVLTQGVKLVGGSVARRLEHRR
jgi:D-methionine transport system permease protein